MKSPRPPLIQATAAENFQICFLSLTAKSFQIHIIKTALISIFYSSRDLCISPCINISPWSPGCWLCETVLMQEKAFRGISLLLHQHLIVILPSQTGTTTLLPYFLRNNELTWQKSFLMSIYKLLLCINSLNVANHCFPLTKKKAYRRIPAEIRLVCLLWWPVHCKDKAPVANTPHEAISFISSFTSGLESPCCRCHRLRYQKGEGDLTTLLHLLLPLPHSEGRAEPPALTPGTLRAVWGEV